MSSVVVRSKPFIRHTTPEDLRELSRTMRQKDREEVFHASGGVPYAALSRGFSESCHCHTVVWDGKVVGIFGIVGVRGVYGSPWMLGADDLGRCWSLLRECREIVQGYLDEYKHLANCCWSQNTVHINWIKWLGFTFDGETIRNGEVFLNFHKEQLCVNQ